MRMPTARAMLPFCAIVLRTAFQILGATPGGRQRLVTQAEGGEQGDPLMPQTVFYQDPRSIGGGFQFHGARRASLCAFLDDVYVLCAPQRVVPLFNNC